MSLYEQEIKKASRKEEALRLEEYKCECESESEKKERMDRKVRE